MKFKKLTDTIQSLSSGAVPFLSMYFVFKNENEPTIRLVDIDKSVQDDLAEKFTRFLIEKISNRELVTGNISTADERKYDVLEFDIDQISPLDELQALLKEPDRVKYSHKRDKNLQLDGYIFIMGNNKVKLAFFKEHYPFDVIERDNFVLFGRSDSRFVAVPDDEVFRLNDKIDFLQIDSTLYVLNMKVMETNFKIHNLLSKEAEAMIKEINKGKVLENPEFINQIIIDKPSFARKVLRINKESPVIKLPFEDIKTFVNNHPHLSGKLKYNKSGKKFSLHSKKSAELFVKLMDDDFLKSELTQRLYDSITKDRLDKEVQNPNKKVSK